MNAGCYGQEISDNLIECEIIKNNGDVAVIQKDDIIFGYRSSSLDDNIVISAKFKVDFDKRERINKKIQTFIKKEKKINQLALELEVVHSLILQIIQPGN